MEVAQMIATKSIQISEERDHNTDLRVVMQQIREVVPILTVSVRTLLLNR